MNPYTSTQFQLHMTWCTARYWTILQYTTT